MSIAFSKLVGGAVVGVGGGLEMMSEDGGKKIVFDECWCWENEMDGSITTQTFWEVDTACFGVWLVVAAIASQRWCISPLTPPDWAWS